MSLDVLFGANIVIRIFIELQSVVNIEVNEFSLVFLINTHCLIIIIHIIKHESRGGIVQTGGAKLEITDEFVLHLCIIEVIGLNVLRWRLDLYIMDT